MIYINTISKHYKSVIENILADGLDVTVKNLMIYLNQHSSYCTQAVVTEFCVKDGMHLTISDGNCTFHGKEPGTKVNVGHNWFLIDKDVYIILYAGGNADAYGVNIAICRNTAPMYINMLKKHYNQI